MSPARWAAGLVLAACCLLAGCATARLIPDGQRSVELDTTPFFPQLAHQCGPAALATVLGASGIPATPEQLVPLVYLPERRGSLQIEMQAAPRGFGRLAYPIDGELSAVFAELDAGRPVLVLHNYGLPFLPRWHYAVVIGFDAASGKMLLRSGATRRQQMSARTFMRAWDNGGRWGLVILKPGELPAAADAPTFLESATAFERTAPPAAAQTVYEAALRAWPDQPLAWAGRGTAQYRGGRLREAAIDYQRALALDPALAGARNNLAMTLLELGCPQSARRELQALDTSALAGDALRAAVADTAAQVDARGDQPDAPSCSNTALPARGP